MCACKREKERENRTKDRKGGKEKEIRKKEKKCERKRKQGRMGEKVISLRMPNVVGTCKTEVGKSEGLKRIREERRSFRRNADADDRALRSVIIVSLKSFNRLIASIFAYYNRENNRHNHFVKP